MGGIYYIAMYFMEIGWRINYLILSFVFCSISCIYYGEFILAFCREPWYNEWEMDSRQYVNPQEIWSTYTKISFLLSFMLVYPLIGLHVIVYLLNSLTSKEVWKLISYWVFSNISICLTWYILVDFSRIGALRDLSHFDEDTEIIYVPNLTTYIDSWFSFMLSGLIVRQLPLIWIYRNSIRRKQPKQGVISNFYRADVEPIENRLWFILVFRFPSLISALLLFDDIRLAIMWVMFLRLIYVVLLFMHNLYQNY